MNDSVRRYSNWCEFTHGHAMSVNDDGPFVLFGAYDQLAARLAASEAEVGRLAGSLAACGVIVGCDNAESYERWKLADDNPYRTDSSAAVTRLRAECSMFERQSTEWMLLAESNAKERDSLRAKLANSQTLLAMLYDKWENGDNCYEEPDTFSGFMGKAFKLNDEEEKAVLAALQSSEKGL